MTLNRRHIHVHIVHIEADEHTYLHARIRTPWLGSWIGQVIKWYMVRSSARTTSIFNGERWKHFSFRTQEKNDGERGGAATIQAENHLIEAFIISFIIIINIIIIECLWCSTEKFDWFCCCWRNKTSTHINIYIYLYIYLRLINCASDSPSNLHNVDCDHAEWVGWARTKTQSTQSWTVASF